MATAIAIRETASLTQQERAMTVPNITIPEEKRRESFLCMAEGDRLGLYAIIGEAGPVTLFGLAQEARIPMSLVLRWLASQTQSGYVVRDVVTGRYRTWCILPQPEAGNA